MSFVTYQLRSLNHFCIKNSLCKHEAKHIGTVELMLKNSSKSWCKWRSRIDKRFLELFSVKIGAIYDHLTKKLKHFQLFDSFQSDIFFFLFLLNYCKLFKNVTLLIVDSKKCQKISVLKLQNDVYTLHNTIF